MAKPAVILVGADKGGVGKTTVARTLLDYFTAHQVPTRAFDRSAYLRLLLVAETDQSRGIGSALLERGEAAARRGRARHLGLLVTSTNRGARRFYADRGYRHVSTLPNFVRAGLDEALYLKRLRANPRGRRRRAVGR